jgi:hypothetical protein
VIYIVVVDTVLLMAIPNGLIDYKMALLFQTPVVTKRLKVAAKVSKTEGAMTMFVKQSMFMVVWKSSKINLKMMWCQ